MELHLKIIGFLFVALSIIHLIFPKYFKWKDELNKVSLINKEIMQVHTLFIALIVALMGLLCIFCKEEMVRTHLGKMVCFGFGIFWFIRLIIQFFGYSSSHWKGKYFETIVHFVFALFWLYCTIIFFYISYPN
jgi:hypothetical protein